MNSGMAREIIVQVIIVVAVVLGGWNMLIAPRAEALQQLETVIADGESAVASLDEELTRRLSDRLSEVRARIGDIAQANETAEDTSRIYGRFTDLARRHGVRPVNLTSDGGDDFTGDSSSDGVQVIPVHMTLEGPYESVARFLEDTASIGGFIRANSMRVTPLQRGRDLMVTVTVTYELLKFPLSRVRDTMGDDDADA